MRKSFSLLLASLVYATGFLLALSAVVTFFMCLFYLFATGEKSAYYEGAGAAFTVGIAALFCFLTAGYIHPEFSDRKEFSRRFKDHARYKGFWAGEKVTYDFVMVSAQKHEVEPLILPWWAPFIGEKRQAIRVYAKSGIYLIDNEDGYGFEKLQQGFGSHFIGHRGYYKALVHSAVPVDKEIRQFDKDTWDIIEFQVDRYWTEHDRKTWEKIKAIRKDLTAANYFGALANL